MPRIINTFASENPLAKVIGSLGSTMFGGTPTSAVDKQKLLDMQREALAHETGADVIGAANANGTFDFAKAAQAAALGGLKPEDLAMLTSFTTSNMGGYKSPGANNALFGAGKGNVAYDTLEADRDNTFNMNVEDNATSAANNKYSADTTAATSRANNTDDNTRLWDQFQQEPKPAMVGGQPGFVQQGQLTTTPNVAPILKDNEIDPLAAFQRQLPASMLMFPGEPEKARAHAVAQVSKTTSKGMTVFGPDGNPIVQMGGDGSMANELTNANQTKVQGDEISYRKFDGTLGMATQLIKDNPNSVGLVGQARGAAQDLGTMAQSAGQLFGIQDVQGELANAQSEAARYGINLNFEYDPSVSQIESVMNILAFQGARAIGGQSGNDLSDKDLKAIKIILGDPNSLFTNQAKLLSRLELVKSYVDSQRKINLEIMGKAPPATPAATPAVSAPAVPGGTTSKGTTFKVIQ